MPAASACGGPGARAGRVTRVAVPRGGGLEAAGGHARRHRDVELPPQVGEVVGERGEGAAGDLLGLLVRVGHHDLAGDAERRQVRLGAAERRPFRLVSVCQRPDLRRRDERHHGHPPAGAPAGLVRRPRRVPGDERLLHGLGYHRSGVDIVVLPVEGHLRDIGGQAHLQDLEGLVEPGLRLRTRHAVEAGLDRRDTPAHAEDKAAVGELVERGGLFDHPQRGNERQDRDQHAKPDRRREPGRGGQHQVRGGDAKGSAMVLGELVGVVAEPLIGGDQLEALVQLPCRRQAARIVVVEDGEEHRRSLPDDDHAT
jgi:hypothetical protein